MQEARATFGTASARVAALCLTFKLTRSEGRILVQLLTHDCSTAEQLRAAVSPDRKIALSSMRIFLCSLRAKLKPHDIEIGTITKMGYGIDGASRGKIRVAIANYDAEGLPAPPEPNLTPDTAASPD